MTAPMQLLSSDTPTATSVAVASAILVGQTPIHTSGTAGRLLLAALATIALVTLGLVVAAVGAVVRRRTPRASPP